jgi:hypothetical protein
MTEIRNWKVYDLKESVIACRNAMRLEMPEYTEEEFQESLKRAIQLANTPNGSGHQNFLSGIRVSFDLKYPGYLSPELQRYHWIDIVTSSSKMHRLLKMDLDSACNKYVSQSTIILMQELIEDYNQIANGVAEIGIFQLRNNKDIVIRGKNEMLYFKWMQIISNCPQGLELFMRVSTNYLQLKTLYRQRKNHKLKDDWGAICRFIEQLPYAQEFGLCDSK